MNDDLPVIRVLIIDDEIDICVLLSSLLRKHNVPTDYVTSLQEAKTALEKKQPDIIFLDNHLKDGMGLDFIPYIREHAPADVIIMMISAFDGKEEYKKAEQLGVHKFIRKPFSKEDILNAINEVKDSP